MHSGAAGCANFADTGAARCIFGGTIRFEAHAYSQLAGDRADGKPLTPQPAGVGNHARGVNTSPIGIGLGAIDARILDRVREGEPVAHRPRPRTVVAFRPDAASSRTISYLGGSRRSPSARNTRSPDIIKLLTSA